MSLFDSITVNLFSEMKGVVTQNGTPIAGATVRRKAITGSKKEFTDSAVTDKEGRFHFARMTTKMVSKLLPSQPGVYQEVTIEYQDSSYLAWKTYTASDYDKGELNKKGDIGTDREIAIDLTCELTAPDTDKAGAYTSVISGICSWENQKLLD